MKGHRTFVVKRASTDTRLLEKRFGPVEYFDSDSADKQLVFDDDSLPDAIIHAATNYGRQQSNPTSTFWTNEAFAMRLMDLAIHSRIRLIVNMDTFFNSSGQEYDHLGAYTLSKRHFQEWGQFCAKQGCVGFTNMRLFHMYGPGDGLDKFVPSLIARCLSGETIDLTDGVQKRDFIYVKDAARGVVMALESDLGREPGYRHYDVGIGTSISLREFAEKANKLCGGTARLRFGRLPKRAGEFQDAVADSAALRALGWCADCSIEAGIRSVIEDIKQRPYIDPPEVRETCRQRN